MIVSGISHNPLGGSFGFHEGLVYLKEDGSLYVAIPLAGLLVSTSYEGTASDEHGILGRNPLGGSFGFHKKQRVNLSL